MKIGVNKKFYDTYNNINFTKVFKIIDPDMGVNKLSEKNKFPASFWTYLSKYTT